MNPEQLPEDNNVELEAIARNGLEGNDKLDGIEQNTAASAIKLDDLNTTAEANVLATTKLEDPLNKIVENTSKPSKTTFNIGLRKDGDDEEFNENEAGQALWSMLRGPKGYTPVKGKDYFTDEEITTFKEEIRPKPDKDYHSKQTVEKLIEEASPKPDKDFLSKRTTEELIESIRPIKDKDYRDGKDGEDGYTPIKGVDYFDGKNGRDGKDGKDADDVAITVTVIEKVTKEVKRETDKEYDRIKRHVASKSYSTGDLTDTKTATTGQIMKKQADGTWAPANEAAASGVTVETPTGTINSSNTSFTVTAEPKWVVSDGITYFDSAGYSYAALTITMDVPPSSYLRAII